MTNSKEFSGYRNVNTGEVVPAHRIGTTEDGRILYKSQEGFEPVEDYECDAEGNWIPAES